jgi:hypothetical protein
MCTIGTVAKNKPSLLCPNFKLYIPSNVGWLMDGKRCSSRFMSIYSDVIVPSSIEFDYVIFIEKWKWKDECINLWSRPVQFKTIRDA